jgi:uncharacterized membrane protein YphA (DoxX/SURF4 family)
VSITPMSYGKTADILLRLSVAFAFLYPPINAVSDPEAWVGYLPPFVGSVVDPVLALHIFGIVEVGIALWILSGKKIWLPSLAAAAALVGIVVFNVPEFQVLFRDLSLAAAALALAITRWPKKSI